MQSKASTQILDADASLMHNNFQYDSSFHSDQSFKSKMEKKKKDQALNASPIIPTCVQVNEQPKRIPEWGKTQHSKGLICFSYVLPVSC